MCVIFLIYSDKKQKYDQLTKTEQLLVRKPQEDYYQIYLVFSNWQKETSWPIRR